MTTQENPPVSTGAAPSGARNEASAARAVEQMFDDIAPSYDTVNHVLSGNVDRLWWRWTAQRFRDILARPEATVLDLCCGTGDMVLALRRFSPPDAVPAIGLDFSHRMLALGAKKFAGKGILPIEADALHAPFPDAYFDLVTTAFGFRNLANYQAGLTEIHRILKPGAQFGILEFGEPDGLMGHIYRLYFRYVLPAAGTFISGVEGPYKYLPASVARFPLPKQLMEQMHKVGFTDVSWTPYTFGIAGLYVGRKT